MAGREEHGGDSGERKRKGPRPLATKRPLLITVRSERATGPWNLLRRQREVEARVNGAAKRFGVKIRRYVNVGNHIHLVVQAKKRWQIQNFRRVFPQAVMFLVTGAKKGNPVGRFWSRLAWSRIVHWGRDWANVKRYLIKNELEAAGVPRDVIDAFISGKWAPT